MAHGHILVVDDERSILDTLSGVLMDDGYEVTLAENGLAALKRLKDEQPNLVMLDIWMPELDGIETLKQIKETHPELPVIMMSGHGTIEVAVKATRLGAYDFIEKPLSLEKVSLSVSHALEQQRLSEENQDLRRRVEKKYEIIGESAAVRKLKQEIETAGPTNGRVLIWGESGTGKELVARAIHSCSKRRNRPFVELNCAAIPSELIESELFGHEKGAFTSAVAMKRGKFELADEGTLFLDEIGDMSLPTQAKVLRVLQEQEFQRVGGSRTLKVDVRVIAASNKNLEEEIKKGNFREDLFYRLNVILLHVPALRERKDDIPLLARHFIRDISEEYGKKPKEIDEQAARQLIAYGWPGNVRELRNVCERLVIMVQGNTISAADIPAPVSRAEAAAGTLIEDIAGDLSGDFDSLRDARQAFERDFIMKKLKENDWNVSRTAEALKVERSNLHRKLKGLGIEAE